MATLEKAIAIAAMAHSGQVDKAGQPYILHPLAVMSAMKSNAERIVAVLHDVVEDTTVTLDMLRAEGFSPAVLAGVNAMTKRPGETRMDAARRAKVNPLAHEVKMADVCHNMDFTRITHPTSEDQARLQEYRAVLWFLLHGDGK